MANLNENAIREAAYYIWQNSGCPWGKEEQFWAMAIEQVSSSTKTPCKSSSKCSCSKTASTKSATTKTVAKKTVSKKTSK